MNLKKRIERYLRVSFQLLCLHLLNLKKRIERVFTSSKSIIDLGSDMNLKKRIESSVAFRFFSIISSPRISKRELKGKWEVEIVSVDEVVESQKEN